jgi:hypothetical protein
MKVGAALLGSHPSLAIERRQRVILGRNVGLANLRETLWDNNVLFLPETIPSSFTIEAFSTGADTVSTGASVVTVFGLDANGLETQQDFTLNGGSAVVIPGTWNWINSARVKTSVDSLGNLGTILIRTVGTLISVCRIAPQAGESYSGFFKVPLNQLALATWVSFYLMSAGNSGQIEAYVRRFKQTGGPVQTLVLSSASYEGSHTAMNSLLNPGDIVEMSALCISSTATVMGRLVLTYLTREDVAMTNIDPIHCNL